MDIWKLLAGLMLFILAMSLIEDAIRALAGNRVKDFISRSTRSPLKGLLAGTAATAVLQSSSLVGLLTLAFVGAGALHLTNALLIIFGANLGTTFTGWLVTLIGFKLDLEALSLPLISAGGLAWVAAGRHRMHHAGKFFLALGLLLMGLEFMKTGVEAVQAVNAEYLSQFNTLQFLAFGIAFSALLQSSSAAMVITLSALNLGIIDLHAAAAVVIGADLGTTSTVVLGAIRGSANKKRVALGHVLFNVITDTLAFLLLVPLVAVVSIIDDPLLSLVAFHSAFNLLGVCLCTPFVSSIAAFLQNRFSAEQDKANRYLDAAAVEVPDAALQALDNELANLASRVISQNAALFSHSRPSATTFRQSYQVSKQLEAEMLAYALSVDITAADDGVGARLEALLTSARAFLLSSKLCKDNLQDLQELADYQPRLYAKLVSTANRFYVLLQTTRAQGSGPCDAEQISELTTTNEHGHRLLHNLIYTAVKDGELPLDKVTTVLNVNRALYNANTALIEALAVADPGQPQAAVA